MKYRLVAFSGGVLCTLLGETNFWDFVRKLYSIPNLRKPYMEGKITRAEMMEEYKYWREKGLTKSKLEEDVRNNLKIMPGARELFAQLRSHGIASAIISGSADILVRQLAKELNPKYTACNEIVFDKNDLPHLTRPTHPTKDARMDKIYALQDFAAREKITKKDCAVVGHHKEQIEWFHAAAFSIAFNPLDDEIAQAASVVVESTDMRDLAKYLIKEE